MYNNITRYKEIALWMHPELAALALERNNIKIPFSNMYMPSLTFLHLGENNITIDKQFNKNSLPNIVDLYLNGNNLQAFPSESLKDTLVGLGIARCNLKSLPSYLSTVKSLKYLDARDNSITSVSDDLKRLLENNEVESYFSGNVVCKTESSLDCEPLCSKVCWSRHVANNGECDISCNSNDCHFDGGECRHRYSL